MHYRETYPEIPQTNPQPPQNIVVEASEGEDFDINLVQPQGTTKRPFEQVPSLSDLPTTTPLPSPLLQHQFINVPNSNQGNVLQKSLRFFKSLPSYFMRKPILVN